MFYQCPACDKTSIKCRGIGQSFKNEVPIHPNSNAKQFPDYIPEAIRKDYEEAHTILYLSPKSSATLSRRCLQSMIRDYWKIKGKKNLYEEIESIKDKVHPSQWKAIDAVRSIGNIGAHMEKDINLIIDIEDDEAEKLLKLIELLLDDWYIRRHENDILYADITGISEEKRRKKHQVQLK